MLKSTSLPIVSSVGRALEYARRAVFPVKAVVLTWSVRDGRVGFAGDEEMVVGGVVKGVVTVVVAIRAVKQKSGRRSRFGVNTHGHECVCCDAR